MRFNRSYFEKYGRYRNDVKEIKQFRKFIFDSKRVLWVGCSTGKGVKYLNDRNVDCIGVDINDHAILMSRIPDKLLKADILALPFKDEKFDCVICIDLLEHLSEGQMPKALSELKRVSSDKIIVGVTPKERKAFHADPTHITGLTFDEWEQFLDERLPGRIASDFYDARYVFSKKAIASRASLSVDVHHRIADLNLSSFNQADLVFSKEQLCFIENLSPLNLIPQYLTIKKHGRIAGFCPSFIFDDERLDADENSSFFEKCHRIAREIRFNFDKSIVAYSPFTYNPEIQAEQDYNDAAKLVCRKINEICQKKFINVSTILCLCKDERRTVDIIKSHGYRGLKLYPNTKLTTGFNSLRKYLSLLSGKYGEGAPDMLDSVRNIEDERVCHQMKTCNNDKLVPDVALMKFRNWKARTVMNAYIGLAKILYRSKMAP